MSKRKRVAVALLFCFGILILMYPAISNGWNCYVNKQAIGMYEKTVQEKGVDLKKERERAEEYNETLGQQVMSDAFSEEKKDEEYESLLNVDGNGMMGYISIPKIKINLPIYHGTNRETLEKGAGHLMGSSLPIGGEGTHAVISAHCGLPSARFFTDLEKLKTGDMFYLHVLGNTLTYCVDQILVVHPEDTSFLAVEPGKDYVTLVTCTPYGVNTHRLLVRGYRVENDAGEEMQSTFSKRLDTVTKKSMITGGLMMKRKIIHLAIIMLLVCGVAILLYPLAGQWMIANQGKKEEAKVKQLQEDLQEDDGNYSKLTSASEWEEYKKLYQKMQEYNEELLENGQDLSSASNYENVPKFYQKDEAIGYIKIPDMNCNMPLFIGASKKHMAKGAAVLTETSMPIGGENTNCVIAGHRGYKGVAYFKHIERLKKGSEIMIGTPWDTLTYEVTETKIIAPEDMDEIMIQKGKDMVTIITCHPYMSHGKQRYLVYAARK